MLETKSPEKACKGTTKNAYVQVFLEKNAFLDKKSVHRLHLATVASRWLSPF